MTLVVRYGGHGGFGLREERKSGTWKKSLAGEIQNHSPIRRLYRLGLRREGTWARIARWKIGKAPWNMKNG